MSEITNMKPPAGRDDIRSDDFLVVENRLIDHTTDTLEHLMEVRGVTRSILAARMDRSPARITQILRGHNIKLRTLADLAYALDYEIRLAPIPLDRKF